MASLLDNSLNKILNTQRFDFEQAANSAAWIRELNNVHTPETEEYGISSFVFEARHPFHPERLAKALDHPLFDDVIRAKGVFWLATRPAYIGLYSKAGQSHILEPIGTWWHTQNKDSWEVDDDEKAAIEASWHPLWGDRVQQLVFIGIAMDEAALRQLLTEALLDDAEAAAGLPLWSTFNDPLPLWH